MQTPDKRDCRQPGRANAVIRLDRRRAGEPINRPQPSAGARGSSDRPVATHENLMFCFPRAWLYADHPGERGLLRSSKVSNLLQTFTHVEFLMRFAGYTIEAGENGLYSRQ